MSTFRRPQLAAAGLACTTAALAFAPAASAQAVPAQPLTAEPAGALAGDPHPLLVAGGIGVGSATPAGTPERVRAGVRADVPAYAPPTHRERRRAYLGDLFGPRAGWQAVTAAGFDQWQDAPAAWRQGVGGYGQRVLSRAGGVAAQLTLEHGLSAALRHDLHYAPLGAAAPRGARVWHAVSGAALARRADGRRTPAVGTLAGAYGGRLAETSWQPGGASHAEAATSLAFNLAFRALGNVAREFRR